MISKFVHKLYMPLFLRCAVAMPRTQSAESDIAEGVELSRTPEEEAYMLRIKAMAENRHNTESEYWAEGI